MIGEISAENSKERELLRETLENAGFVTAEYVNPEFENCLVILAKRK